MADLSDARKPVVWSIAGSDSGGGAGLQADLLTLQALGVHACTVVSTLTAQNSVGVSALSPVDDALFLAQIRALAADLPPAAIKIGLLGSQSQVDQLCQHIPDWRQRWPSLHVILDPVMVATSGDRLQPDSVDLSPLLPHCDLITPNLPELVALCGQDRITSENMAQAVKPLLAQGCAILVTGGHDTGPRTLDRLFQHDACWYFEQPRVDTPHTHGTGCSLSSALAALCALGWPLHDAMALASAWLHHELRAAYPTGAGAGTLQRQHTVSDSLSLKTLPGCRLHGDPWPQPQTDAPENLGFLPCLSPLEGIYPVVPSADWVERLLKAGATHLQLRVKAAPNASTLRQEIRRAVALGREYQAQVFINDHWQEAIQLGAYGVHLGQEDCVEADLSAIRDAGLRLGLSTHGLTELLRVLPLRPSYVALGHLFPTCTKVMPSQPQGLEKLRLFQQIAALHQMPTVAIGGIKARHLASIRACGVACAAVVTAITEAPEPIAAFRALQQELLTSATDCTLERLLAAQYASTDGLAVAVNQQVIPRQQWSVFRVQPDDALHVFNAVAGG